ncbi:MAG: acyltransferase [Polyangiaceae bacterium]
MSESPQAVPDLAEAPRRSRGAAKGDSHDPLPRMVALDGVRGLAVLLVMLHHFMFLPKDTLIHTGVYAVRKLGWTGVELFFVLSGYLITSILIEYRGDGRYFSAFYARRALRILPLYYVVVAASFFLLPAFINLGELKGSPGWYWFQASNWHMAFNGFSHKTLCVCWSLAIEEQFYLIWPLVVGLTPPRLLGRVALGVFIGSSLLSIGMSAAGAPWVMTYTLTPCRLGGLALGGFLATVPQEKLRASSKAALRVGGLAAAVSAAVLLITRSTHMEGRGWTGIGFTALSVLWASVITLALSAPVVTRVFSSRPLTFLGKYSYGLYLWHMPVAIFVRDSVFGPKVWPRVFGTLLVGQLVYDVLAMAVSIAVAWVSWRALEEPILRLKKHFHYARMGRAEKGAAGRAEQGDGRVAQAAGRGYLQLPVGSQVCPGSQPKTGRS